MVGYKKAYLKYHGLTEADWIGCKIPNCGQEAVDLHHIFGRSGELLKDPTKLIPLCRIHHINISRYSKDYLLTLL